MSMNLYAETKKERINLWQTSTQISYTILPKSFGAVKGKKATEALQRYMEWVRNSTNGAWESREELEVAIRQVNDHLEYIQQFLDNKSLEVWVM